MDVGPRQHELLDDLEAMALVEQDVAPGGGLQVARETSGIGLRQDGTQQG